MKPPRWFSPKFIHSSSLIAFATLLALQTAALLTAPAVAQGRLAAMVVDANTGAILHADAAEEPRHPASLTKMMTLYLVFEQIELGRLSYGTKIKISEEAAAAAPSKLDLDPGEEITVLDAIKALITKSANDVAVALAEHISGSEARFAQLMSERARQIGMKASHFRNASGLPDAAQVTTARDMIALGLRLQDEFPQHYPLFLTRQFSHEGRSYRNHNTLLFNYQGTEGLKTGYTRMSGFNLVASVRRGKKHVIGAVFGGGSAGSRDALMRTLLTKAFTRASPDKTRRSAPMVTARSREHPQPLAAARPVPTRTASGAPSGKPQPMIVPPIPIEVSRGRLAAAPGKGPETGGKPQDVRPGYATESPASPAISRNVVHTPPASWQTTPRPEIPARPPTPVVVPVPVQVTNPNRGTAPSSLQAQAQRLTLGGPHAPAALPQPPAAAGSAEVLQIQVGAYPSAADAQRQLTTVRAKAASLLNGHSPLVVPVQKESRQLFRARFTGFDAQSAGAACLELRRLAVDCFVMR